MNFLRRAITSARAVPALLETAAPTNKISILQSNARLFSNLTPVSSSICKVSNASSQILHNNFASQGDQDLLSILKEEIAGEKEQSAGKCPQYLRDFAVKYERSEITLTKKFADEVISLSMDVNHSVEPQPDEVDGQEAPPAMEARPSFEVDVKVGSKVMSFTCSFLDEDLSEGGEPQDLWGINEVTVYEGEWNTNNYCAAGDLLDENLYDKLLDYLLERGVDDAFVTEMSQLCSQYEHNLYVKFMQDMEGFLNRK